MVERQVNNDEPPSDGADSVALDIRNPPADSQMRELHPVIKIMQERELGKAAIAFSVPIAMGIIVSVGMGDKDAPWEMSLILVVLCVGVAGIFNGILLKETYPPFAQIVEAVGISLVVIGFFVVISFCLPAWLSWVPALCIGLCLFPFTIALRQRHAPN